MTIDRRRSAMQASGYHSDATRSSTTTRVDARLPRRACIRDMLDDDRNAELVEFVRHVDRLCVDGRPLYVRINGYGCE